MKQMLHEKKDCGARYEVEYTDDGVPYLVCSGCEHRVDDWVKWDREYSSYWKDKSRWSNKRDHIVCLLGLFVSLYESHYGTKFGFSLNERGLFRSAEANHIRKLCGLFDSDAHMAADYIRWVFEKKVVERKRKITSLGFLNIPASINEFKLAKVDGAKVRRSTPLPTKMKAWLSDNLPEIALKDYGDLRSMLGHYKKGRIEKTPKVVAFVEKLQTSQVIGPDFEIIRWSE